jgi:hypothetical protein
MELYRNAQRHGVPRTVLSTLYLRVRSKTADVKKVSAVQNF